MPELPEVETTRRGIVPHAEGQRIDAVIIRNRSLRWPIPSDLQTLAEQQKIQSITRRSKYLLFKLEHGMMILHLGMSGSLRIVDQRTPPKKHDHVDIVLGNAQCIRFNDPRRFGCLLWSDDDSHALLSKLGPEPLQREFNAKYLRTKVASSKRAIKSVIMDAAVVVGVGNIYATEALYMAGIHPQAAAHSISAEKISALVRHIKAILRYAINRGGTTLRDFLQTDGKPGYFAQELQVYGRSGECCHQCQTVIEHCTISQRRSAYCPQCQAE